MDDIPGTRGRLDRNTQAHHNSPELYWYEVEPEDYTRFYNYQIAYLNQAVLEAIDQILEEADKRVHFNLGADTSNLPQE